MSTGKWWDESWQVCTGCTPVSEACENCYAARLASTRLKHHPRYEGLAKYGRWTGEVRLNEDQLEKPLHWRKPRVVFPADMSDIGHPDVPFDFIDKVFAVMALTPQHTYRLLTKRPERMAEYLDDSMRHDNWSHRIESTALKLFGKVTLVEPPLPNVQLGVTAENQPRADERISTLLQIPAAVHFVSIESMLGPVDLKEAAYYAERLPESEGLGLDWVICGGESGPGARPMKPAWVRPLRDQCVAAGVPFWFKQWGVGRYWLGPCKLDWAREGEAKLFSAGRSGLGNRTGGRLLDGREWNQLPGDLQ